MRRKITEKKIRKKASPKKPTASNKPVKKK